MLIGSSALRFGVVEAVSTPPAVEGSRPASGHLSLVHNTTDYDDQQEPGISPASQGRSHSSLMPQSATLTRSSYVTSTSEGSRISALSDFPSPPTDVTPAHMPIIQSYFAGYTPRQEVDDPMENTPPPPAHPPPLLSPQANLSSPADTRASRRTTFGEDSFIMDGSAP
jgi:serine/arginine repetitive matrix protein 2